MGEPDGSGSKYGSEIGRRIELPLQGLREVPELPRTLERVERELVAAARRNWSSWEEIGGALGISRQAAHARHAPFVKRKGGSWPRSSG